MERITSVIELKESILLLEIKQANEGRLLKEQFKTTYENLRPVNLIKNSFREFVKSPDLKTNLLDLALGIAAGYLSKKIAIGSTINPFKQLLGNVLQMGVTGVVAKNTGGIKSKAIQLIQHFLNNKNKSA